jgi:hypothetical protein
MSTPEALRDVQSHFGARRSSCDESGQFCWDTIDSAIAEIERLTAENFALAAGQCPNVTGDEGGTPRCAEIERLNAAHHAAVELSNAMHGRWLAAEAERDALRKDAERYRNLRDGSEWPAVFASAHAPEPLRGVDLDAAMSGDKP